ncbi:MAG: type IV pilus assembly protein PilM [Pseudohongiella sp.]
MLGIDIGHQAIKLVVLARRRYGWCLQAYAVQPLPVAARGASLLASAAVRDGLAAALRQLPGRVRDAAVALNCDEAITRTIRLDAGLTDQGIENELAIEADQHLPFPLSDSSMDFCRVPASAGDKSPGQDVFLVACRQDTVAQRVQLLTELGLRPAVVDLDAMALGRMAGWRVTTAPQVLMDLGASGFRLHAFADRRLVYSRAHQMTDLPGSDFSAGSVPQQNPDHTARLVQEVRRAIQLFLISTTCKEPEISLVGGLASLPGLAETISGSCGQPASLLQPPSHIKLHAQVDAPRWRQSLPQLALACALAMRERG